MYIVRDTFTAKPGMASKLAGMFKRVMPAESGVRVVTDLVGSYNTVEMEFQFASLAEYEKFIDDYKTGKAQFNPEAAEEMKNYTSMWKTGKREIFQVWE